MDLKLNEFKTIKVKLNAKSSVIRDLFVKELNSSLVDERLPKGICLLVANIPPFVDDDCIRRLFTSFGPVVSVRMSHDLNFESSESKSKFFDKKPTKNPNLAAIVFETPDCVQNALRFECESPLILYEEPNEPFTGVKKWQKEYNDAVVDREEMKNEIDEYMKAYDERVEREIREAKEKAGVPDEEGWITVGKHGKHSFIPNNEHIDNLILAKKRKSDKILTNFYNFQKAQTKIDNLHALRAKFEEDKKRLALMKATRKFKPFK
ncbi:ribosomal RNA-processing protein 7 A-like protein [Dinothrombium tinctorium]|uniref:Ribosomal RNA-processing protein 7 A-like protein n=1 Tax=Dinothrombium tinctorium TaxID=1965070 RepID=A0A3S4RGX1_9ACAR|nr:ribosomal RNA-processing protein 7 A-like protein [Dinothrombium tinctorium]RWS16044.1 ribosomal RNA-processing protein 7 A-like protein [Dinothrombium tinctorium]